MMDTDKQIYTSLLRFAKVHGFDDVVLHKDTRATYSASSSSEEKPIYRMRFYKAGINSEDGQYWPVNFTVPFEHGIASFEAQPIELMIAGSTWIDAKNSLEEVAQLGATVKVYEIRYPLMKPYETFERAMIRCELYEYIEESLYKAAIEIDLEEDS